MHQIGARLGKGGRLAYVSTYYQYPPLPVWGVVFIPHTPVWVPCQPGRPGAPQATSSYIFPVKIFFFLQKLLKKCCIKTTHCCKSLICVWVVLVVPLFYYFLLFFLKK